MRTAKRPLNPEAVKKADEAVGRPLKMSSEDADNRQKWMDAYLKAGGQAEEPASSQPAGSPVQQCAKAAAAPGPMTEDEAAKWMKDFKANRKDIPFDWPRDCCYTRAREMSKALAAQGRTSGKVWNYAPSGQLLVAKTPNVKEGQVEWGYHVAPTVPVRRKDGTVTDMVIDPSLSDKPLTPEEWKGLQGNPNSVLATSDTSPYYRYPDGRVMPDPGDADVRNTLAGHRANRAIEPK